MSTNNNKNNKQKSGFSYYWIYGGIIAIMLVLSFLNQSFSSVKNISYDQFFTEILPTNDVAEITIVNRKEAKIRIKESALKKEEYKDFSNGVGYKDESQYEMEIGDLQNFENGLREVRSNDHLDFKTYYKTETSFLDEYGFILPMIALVAIWIFLFRRMGGATGGAGGQIFNIGKSRAKLFDQNQKVKVTFKDVAGLEGAKEEVQEVVDFLKTPDKYTKLGGKIPKGVLLVGPPGTGKTLLAKAVAGEANVPFFSLSGSDFVEMFVGVGASRVRDLFEQAKKNSPAIIFIDEIDAVGRARGKNNFTGANDERENTLNALLTEMDGFGTETNVIVMAATNRADVLDKALLRPGRFDRQISVDLPELSERKEILEVHLKPIKKAANLDLDFLAKQTPGFSGADLANICNEAALVAARKGHTEVENQDFLDAIDRIIGGLEKRNKVIKPEEKRRIAYHEAGHATVSWMTEHASPLVKVTIVPRGQSLGAAWYLPEERTITTTEQMLDQMAMALGGRAAEEVVFGNISTGALSDLEKVTKQAQAMVTIYGLNKKLGNISFYDSSGQADYSFQKPYSEETAQLIDKEISNLIENQYIRAKDILQENRVKLDEIANLLLEKEVIFKDDLERILGKRPHERPEEEIVESHTGSDSQPD